jgi:hypothetical protein
VAYAIDHGTSRTGRWLRERYLRLSLWIAVIEIVLAAFLHDFSRWTIVALAIISVLLYIVVGRRVRADAPHQVLRIAAVSQCLAVIGVILIPLLGLFVLVLAAVFAAIALVLILSDRR